MTAYFILPEFYKFLPVWGRLLTLDDAIFIPDRKIAGFYGSFPSMKWNGGRTVLGSIPDEQLIESVFSFYHNFGGINLTLTNSELNEADLDDKYCHLVLKYANKYHESALVVNNKLEKLLRAKYPNVTFNRSVITNLTDFDKPSEYKYNVINHKYNHDIDYLSSIKDKEHTILLANSNCKVDCPLAKEHYRHLSRCQLDGVKPSWDCTHKCASDYKQTYISSDEIDRYVMMGFNKFKLVDREILALPETIKQVVGYLIKLEYRELIRSMLMTQAKEVRDE